MGRGCKNPAEPFQINPTGVLGNIRAGRPPVNRLKTICRRLEQGGDSKAQKANPALGRGEGIVQ
jgi:hypothetical protein